MTQMHGKSGKRKHHAHKRGSARRWRGAVRNWPESATDVDYTAAAPKKLSQAEHIRTRGRGAAL